MNCFVKGYWNKNLGDDLFLFILCKKYPNHQFYTSMTGQVAEVFRQITNLHVKKIKFPTLTKAINSLEVRLNRILPRSIFSENFEFVKKFKIAIEIGGSIFMMPKNLDSGGIELKQRKLIRKFAEKYCILGSNFGPYYTNRQVNQYKSFFDTVDDICFRDSYSFNLFTKSQFSRVAPDVVFNLDLQNYVHSSSEKYVVLSIIDPNKKIDFSAIRDDERKKVVKFYKQSVFDIIRLNSEKGVYTVLMSFCDAEGDRAYADMIYKDIAKRSQKYVLVYSYNNIIESLKVLGGAKEIIASRYHAMILGWLLRKPTFVFSYSNKTSEVISDCFPQQSFIDLRKNFDVEFKDSYYFNQIEEWRLKKLVSDSRMQFAYLDKILDTE